MRRHAGFTLIELLVVIAILAVLAVVVVLTLNPAGLLQESRDSNRLSDMATLNSALGYYLADVGGGSLGIASTTYISIPDPSATSTAGDQCQGLNLPTAPTGYTYHCAASSTYKKTDGTGWIPVNLGSLTFGTPLSQLPTDAINTTSTNLYYTYQTNGTQYEVTSIPESQKQKQALGQNPVIPSYPDVMGAGSNLYLSGLYSQAGLVGYWPMDEGSGSSTIDASGNGNGGSWNGNASGTSGYYSGGKVGSYAGTFDGSTDYINAGTNSLMNIPNTGTVVAWVNAKAFSFSTVVRWSTNTNIDMFFESPGVLGMNYFDGSSWHTPYDPGPLRITVNSWTQVAVTYSSLTGLISYYYNGQSSGTSTLSVTPTNSPNGVVSIGGANDGQSVQGLLDDVRVYSRALSAAEVQAIYNAEK